MPQATADDITTIGGASNGSDKDLGLDPVIGRFLLSFKSFLQFVVVLIDSDTLQDLLDIALKRPSCTHAWV